MEKMKLRNKLFSSVSSGKSKTNKKKNIKTL